MTAGAYVGRFAPSPSGPLHAGSLAAALASWLDARAHGGRWLVRIEDVDTQRCKPAWAPIILDQLARCGLHPDLAPMRQEGRHAHYQAVLDRLMADGHLYACTCSRRNLQQQAHAAHGEAVYPGTCRHLALAPGPGRALRVRAGEPSQPLLIAWQDRRLGPQIQNVTHDVGDFVVWRREGMWAYQLAAVTDDALQGVTHVVRGEDLASNTARQIHLQRLLGWPTPAYLHTPLVLDAQGHKLSKHTGAPALELTGPACALEALRQAANTLGLPLGQTAASTVTGFLQAAVAAWAGRWAVA